MTRPCRIALPLALLLLVAGDLQAQALKPARTGGRSDLARKQAALRRDEELKEDFEEHGLDRADLRKEWDLLWFGGEPTSDYLEFKGRLAQEAMARAPHTFPTTTTAGRPMPYVLAPSGAGGTWTNLGPTSNLTYSNYKSVDSGRPVAVVPHPNYPATPTLYLATSGGGVFKSVDAVPGSAGDWTWIPLTDGLPASGASGNVAVGYLAMDPSNADILYLGLGDAYDARGQGFYKSTDGGTSWTAAAGMTGATITYDICVVGTKIFVATNAGLKVSTDGGASFSAVSGTPRTGVVWTVKALSATDLVCSKNNGTAYWSADAGATWTAATGITGAKRVTLATSAASSSLVWGIYENTASSTVARGVLHSTDKGHSYSFIAAPSGLGSLFQSADGSMSSDGDQGWYNQLLAVDPANPSHLFVGANLALWRSLDGGAHWDQMSHWLGDGHPYAHADFHASAFNATGSTLFVANDGGLAIFKDPYRASIPTTTDDLTFVDNTRNRGLATHLAYNLGSTLATSPTDSKYRISLGLQDNGTRVRRDMGSGLQNSATFEDGIGGDGFGTVIHPTDGNLFLGSLYYTQIQKSSNGGSSFIPAASGITEAGDKNLAPFAPKIALGAVSTPGTVYTFVKAKVYKSTGFASNWTALSMPAGFAGDIRNVSASRSNANAVAFCATGGRYYVTYDNGATWNGGSDITNGDQSASYVWFNTENDQTVYGCNVALNAAGHHLFKSVDGGITWTFMDQTPAGADNGFPFGIPVHVIQNQPGSATTLYAGTDFGVYRSLDGGTTWARFGSGMPLVATRDLYLAPDGSFIRAATFGRGVWEIAGGPALALSLTESGPLQVAPGGSLQVHGTLSNATDPNITWTTVPAATGSFSPSTTLSGAATTWTSPGTPQVVSLVATSVQNSAVTATIQANVYDPASMSVAVSPTPVIVVSGDTQQFTATPSNAPGNGVTWSLTGTGTLSGTGFFTAPTLGTGTAPVTITATSVYPGVAGAPVAGSASVTVKSLDLNGDAAVDFQDMAFLAKAFGTATPAAKLTNASATVDTNDITKFIALF